MTTRNMIIGVILVVLVFVGAYFLTRDVYDTPNLANVDPMPTVTFTTSPTPGDTTSPTTGTTAAQIALVSLDAADQGNTFGCGDMIVEVPVTSINGSANTSGDLQSALNELFGAEANITAQDGAELYNALSQSDLVVSDVSMTDNTVDVYLTGNLSLAGSCDNPRVEQQLTQTILANTNASEVNIYLNDEPLSDALSLR